MNLLEYAAPSAIGRIALEAWAPIEGTHGLLPAEYKEIISALGFGSFGAITLLHPRSTYEVTNLGSGRVIFWDILRESFPEASEFLIDSRSILGLGPERHVIAWVNSWWHIDFEMQEMQDMGHSLCRFLLSEYQTAISNPSGQRTGNSVWSTGSGRPSDFFSPATVQANISNE